MNLTRLGGWLPIAAIMLLSALMSACGESEPYRFGFIGGLSGRVSDLGGPARNGMLLAIEEANQLGGIDGRQIESLIKDDKQDPETAKAGVKQLIQENVDVIIGPTTSAMAMAVVDQANASKILMMGVTVTTNELAGIDDYFLRGLAPARIYASKMADYLYYQMGLRTFASAYDKRNESYSKGWSDDFHTRFTENGGRRTDEVGFTSGKNEDLVTVAEKLLAGNPDVVVLTTNSVDAALLAKLIHGINEDVFLATSEWAGTERLIELGGRHVENAIVPQYLDRGSQDPEFLAFRERFLQRFNHEPGFPGMIGYNVTRVIIDALKNNPDPKQLKQTILGKKVYPGIQGELVFDKFGEVTTRTYVTQIRSGKFVVQASP